MRKILISISFLFTVTISGFCQADTISYWHVYLDNKLINEFSVIIDSPIVKIKASDINKNSILTVDYFRDTPRHNSRKYLVICNSEDNIISKIKGIGTLNKYTLKLDRLIEKYSKGKESSFKIYFKEAPYQDQYLFTLTFNE
jgi:hypothetical protein